MPQELLPCLEFGCGPSFPHSWSSQAEGCYHHPPGPPGPGWLHVCGSWPLAHLPCRRGVHRPMDQREDVFPGLFPGVLSRRLRPCWKAVRSDLPGLASGGWRLNPHGHLKKVRALWTSSGTSLPVGMPLHLLFISHCPPRITRRLVWPSVSFWSRELFLPPWKGVGWVLSESWTNLICSGKRVWL